jgi:hypothetical protein
MIMRDEVSELETKLETAVSTINEQHKKIFELQKQITTMMSPENREYLWRETTERLQQLEFELSLCKKSEEKAAEYNRFLIEKLIRISRNENQ